MNWLDACHVVASVVFGLLGTSLYFGAIRAFIARKRASGAVRAAVLLGSAAVSLLAASILVWFNPWAGLVFGVWPVMMLALMFAKSHIKVVSSVSRA